MVGLGMFMVTLCLARVTREDIFFSNCSSVTSHFTHCSQVGQGQAPVFFLIVGGELNGDSFELPPTPALCCLSCSLTTQRLLLYCEACCGDRTNACMCYCCF